MTVTKAPAHIPITHDDFTAKDYAAVPGEVDRVITHEPERLTDAWRVIAADGYVSPDEGRALERAIAQNSFFLDRSTAPNSVEAKFLAARLADPTVQLDPAVRASIEAQLAAREVRMQKGEVLSGSFKHDDKLHELTEGLVDLPFEKFLERMPADRWGANLGNYRGGEIKVTARDHEGRVIEQRERMVTETPLSKYLAPLFGHLANDMTKVESIHYGADEVAVKWQVLASDNHTTLSDVGELRILRHGDKTKLEFESEHRIDSFPGTLATLERIPVLNKVVQGTTEAVLRQFFVTCIERYQDVAAGRAPSY